jgi:hypothetical protein
MQNRLSDLKNFALGSRRIWMRGYLVLCDQLLLMYAWTEAVLPAHAVEFTAVCS